MTKRAAHVCPEQGCIELVSGSDRYCTRHQRQHRRVVDAVRPSAAARGYDAEWQKIRAAYLAEHPLCVDCNKKATEVDHIVPLQDGGTHNWSNLRSMCKSHHSRHTARVGGGFGNARKVLG